MTKALLLILVSIVSRSANVLAEHPSFPLMQCINEKVTKGECQSEKDEVINKILPWFAPYMTDDPGHRHLVDCYSFCDDYNVDYFTMQAPCDCHRRRLMDIPQQHSNNMRQRGTAAEEQNDILIGPIQLLRYHETDIQDEHCRDVIAATECFVTFVRNYDHAASSPTTDIDDTVSDGEKNNAPLDGLTILDEVIYDPDSGKETRIDPVTGEVINDDVDDTETTGGEEGIHIIDEEIYDPETGKMIRIDPVTGEVIPDDDTATGGSSADDAGGDEDDVGFAIIDEVEYDAETGQEIPIGSGGTEVYDPSTGQMVPVDDDDDEDIHVVDTVTFDPETGEEIHMNPPPENGYNNVDFPDCDDPEDC